MRDPGSSPFSITGQDREIWRLALPAFGALIAEPLYVLADTAVVGNIGVDEAGGLAIASQLIVISLALFIFLAYGTTGAVARLLGAGKPAEAAHEAVQGLWLAFGVGLVFAASTWVFAAPLVRILGGDESPEVLGFAETYLQVSAFGLPAMLIMLAGVGYLRGLQDTTRPLVVAIVTALGNFVLEAWLIWGLGFSVGASALSTVIFQWIGASLYLWWIGRAVREHGVRLGPDLSVLRKLAVAGGDLFLRTLALRGSLTLALAVAARMGKIELAAHEIAFLIWSAAAYGLDAVAIAGQAMIGKSLGAEDAVEARAVGWRITQWGVLLGVVAAVLMIATRSFITQIFSNDAQVEQLAAWLMWFAALSQPINGVAFALDGVLIGAGDLRMLSRLMALSAAVFMPLAAAVWWTGAGIGWLWAALTVFMAVRAVTLLWRFRSPAWEIIGA